MECEYRDSSVYFKFPDLIEKLNKWMDKAKQSALINQTNATSNTVNTYYMELVHKERKIPIRFQIYPKATVVGADKAMLEKVIAKSKLYFPHQLRFRLIVVNTVQQRSQQPQHSKQKQQQQNEYIIQDFKYKSHDILSTRQYVHSWENDWELARNEDCFNFTTPYMVKMECDQLQIMYCARQQLTQAFPPDIQVDGTELYELSDSLWYDANCFRMDRDCHKCKVLVPYQMASIGKTQQQRHQTREVCVTDTQIRGAPVTWKCEEVLNQCRTNDNTDSGLHSRPCTTCAALAAIIGVLSFVILCGVSFACYYKRRQKQRQRHMTSKQNNNGHPDESNTGLIEPFYEKIIDKHLKTNEQELPHFRDKQPYEKPYNGGSAVVSNL